MARERHDVEALLASAATLAPTERIAFILRRCGSDTAMLRDVETRLRSLPDTDPTTQSPPGSDEDSTGGIGASHEAEPDESTRATAAISVGAFRILRKIGAGGMGEVFLAWDDRLGRRVALKRLRQKDGLTSSMLLHEARTAAQLNNPNIATVHDVVDADGRLHIVMEYLEGETLARRLKHGPLARAEVVEIARQMAKALVFAHDHGVLHCDMKPGNVFVLPDGTVKVLDFGLARFFHAPYLHAGDAGGLSPSLRAAGTLAYMAPEQILGAPLDPRTDIFSLGVVMREMLTGNAGEAAADAPSGSAGPLSLEDVIGRATAWEPAARWQSVAELVEALRQPAIAESRRISALSYARTRDAVRIAYARAGSGTPLVYVRGWISHVDHMLLDENFRALFDGLSARHDVVRFDCRGNGLSERVSRDITLESLTLDLEAVLDACGMERAAIFATCFGGPIAIEFAARHPDRVRALIVDGSFAVGRTLASPAKRMLLRKGLQTIPDAAFLILSYLTSPTTVGRGYRNPQVAREMISPATAAALYDLAFRIDVTDSARRVTAPTLIMHRTRSAAVPIERGRELAQLIRTSQFLELPGSGHNPWDEDPLTVLRIISDFLAEPAND
jgi:pimeloyl-ACP methyl ester carboxylesterase/tRNA A-37 threonylcarbamoyl transferase component Bud32